MPKNLQVEFPGDGTLHVERATGRIVKREPADAVLGVTRFNVETLPANGPVESSEVGYWNAIGYVAPGVDPEDATDGPDDPSESAAAGSFRGRLLSIARRLVDELNRERFEGSTVRELVGEAGAVLGEGEPMGAIAFLENHPPRDWWDTLHKLDADGKLDAQGRAALTDALGGLAIAAARAAGYVGAFDRSSNGHSSCLAASNRAAVRTARGLEYSYPDKHSIHF